MKCRWKRGCRRSQDLTRGCLWVGPVVVHDQMQIEMGRGFSVDLLEEPDELLVAMPRHTVADDFPIQDAQRREQRGGAVALIVVRHGPAAAWLQGKARLRAIEGLDLAFFVDGEDQGLIRGIEIEADHIVELLDELFVAADLESLDEVGLEAMLLPDAAHRGFADPLVRWPWSSCSNASQQEASCAEWLQQ